MDDDNLFDDDDALDYIIYEDASNENSENNKGGCLALFVAFLIPVSLYKIWF
jgi:hypothetical protein